MKAAIRFAGWLLFSFWGINALLSPMGVNSVWRLLAPY